jgi:hypothetical protein
MLVSPSQNPLKSVPFVPDPFLGPPLRQLEAFEEVEKGVIKKDDMGLGLAVRKPIRQSVEKTKSNT